MSLSYRRHSSSIFQHCCDCFGFFSRRVEYVYLEFFFRFHFLTACHDQSWTFVGGSFGVEFFNRLGEIAERQAPVSMMAFTCMHACMHPTQGSSLRRTTTGDAQSTCSHDQSQKSVNFRTSRGWNLGHWSRWIARLSLVAF